MNIGRTTLSFLDLALLLLSAFAYTHFVNIADAETRKKLTVQKEPAPKHLGQYRYSEAQFFGDSNVMLTPFAKKEIAEILTVQQEQVLHIYVAPVTESSQGLRLRQWEKVAARSAAIADAFEAAGQDGRKIVLKVPDKLVSKPAKKQNIVLTFFPAKK